MAGTSTRCELNHRGRTAHRQSAVDAARLYRRFRELHVPARPVKASLHQPACPPRYLRPVYVSLHVL